jgi:ABC-type transporter Mla subunit MlaD
MNYTLINIGIVVFIIFAVISIIYQVNSFLVTTALRHLLAQTSGDLRKVIAELSVSLENVRKITDNINTVTGDVRAVTSSVANLQQNVGKLYSFVSETVGNSVKADFAGLKAGVKTGLETLVNNLREERSDHDERRA